MANLKPNGKSQYPFSLKSHRYLKERGRVHPKLRSSLSSRYTYRRKLSQVQPVSGSRFMPVVTALKEMAFRVVLALLLLVPILAYLFETSQPAPAQAFDIGASAECFSEYSAGVVDAFTFGLPSRALGAHWGGLEENPCYHLGDGITKIGLGVKALADFGVGSALNAGSDAAAEASLAAKADPPQPQPVEIPQPQSVEIPSPAVAEVENNGLQTREENGRIQVYDPQNRKLADGCVGTDCKIRFSINIERGLDRWELIPLEERYRGHEVFNTLFKGCEEYAGQNGDQIEGIIGHWEGGVPEMSTNYNKYNEGIAQGLTPEQAARRTPTGKWATTLGYPYVTVRDAYGFDGPVKLADFTKHPK